MDKITTNYIELQPAYGRDYKRKQEAVDAFVSGADWVGDYQLNFRNCSIRDFAPGTKVLLRYNKQLSVTTHTV